jgi:hypothetical protein
MDARRVARFLLFGEPALGQRSDRFGGDVAGVSQRGGQRLEAAAFAL